MIDDGECVMYADGSTMRKKDIRREALHQEQNGKLDIVYIDKVIRV